MPPRRDAPVTCRVHSIETARQVHVTRPLEDILGANNWLLSTLKLNWRLSDVCVTYMYPDTLSKLQSSASFLKYITVHILIQLDRKTFLDTKLRRARLFAQIVLKAGHEMLM